MQIQNDRSNWRIENGVYHRLRFGDGGATFLQEAFEFRDGAQLEINFDDDAERALIADEKFHHIVTRDVLDDFSTGLDQTSIGKNDAEADSKITNSPVTES